MNKATMEIINTRGQVWYMFRIDLVHNFDFWGIETWTRDKETSGIILLTTHRIELTMYLFW